MEWFGCISRYMNQTFRLSSLSKNLLVELNGLHFSPLVFFLLSAFWCSVSSIFPIMLTKNYSLLLSFNILLKSYLVHWEVGAAPLSCTGLSSFWPCTQGSFLAVLERFLAVPEQELEPDACKTSFVNPCATSGKFLIDFINSNNFNFPFDF